MRVGVDSCVGVSVWPVELHKGYKTIKDDLVGRQFMPAGKDNPALLDQGRRDYKMLIKGSKGAKRMKMRIADVRKPLLCVAEMNDAGFDVIFGAKSMHRAVHATSGEVIPIFRRGKVFEFEVKALPESKAPLERKERLGAAAKRK